jgi:hypothetical protein
VQVLYHAPLFSTCKLYIAHQYSTHTTSFTYHNANIYPTYHAPIFHTHYKFHITQHQYLVHILCTNISCVPQVLHRTMPIFSAHAKHQYSTCTMQHQYLAHIPCTNIPCAPQVSCYTTSIFSTQKYFLHRYTIYTLYLGKMCFAHLEDFPCFQIAIIATIVKILGPPI